MGAGKIEIIYQNDDFLIVNKPAGIVVFSEKKDEKALMEFLGKEIPEIKNVGIPPRYGAVHRLDKDTSGLLIIAKNNEALIFFQKEFKKRSVVKTYLALVFGGFKEDSGMIETLMGRAKNRLKQESFPVNSPFQKKTGIRRAETKWQVEKRFAGFSLLRVFPKTGRKHQIRAHLAHINHPVVGDKLYSFKNQSPPGGISRQLLHSYQLKIFTRDGEEKTFSAPMPEDLKNTLKNLKKYETS